MPDLKQSLKIFLTGIVTRVWWMIISGLSAVVGAVGIFYPDSLLDTAMRTVVAFGAGSILLLAFFVAGFLTYHDLRMSIPLPTHDPEVGQTLKRLVETGGAATMKGEWDEWVSEATALVKEHIPEEQFMFETANDLDKPGKLRLIMGRYESRPR